MMLNSMDQKEREYSVEETIASNEIFAFSLLDGAS